MEFDPITPIQRSLLKDLTLAEKALSSREARFLVDSYYQIQNDRKRHHLRANSMPNEPHEMLNWLATQSETLEKTILKALDIYTDTLPIGQWAKSVYGIGPVITAGLVSSIDLAKAPTVGHIWRIAGLDPSTKWASGDSVSAWLTETFESKKTYSEEDLVMISQYWGRSLSTLRLIYATEKRKGMVSHIAKRPWDARLKTICWHAGQSFMKLAANEKCNYGRLYRSRKDYEIARNETGGNAETAAKLLPKFVAEHSKSFLADGKLPPGQIDARARRWAVKIFLSHFHMVWFFLEHGILPPKPFALSQLQHADMIYPPNPVVGLQEALNAVHGQGQQSYTYAGV